MPEYVTSRAVDSPRPTAARAARALVGGAVALGLAVLAAAGWSGAAGEADQVVIGESQMGVPLRVYQRGGGQTVVFILGGHHGGPEANTVRLVYQLMDFFERYPWEIPEGLRLDFMPEGNPDGLGLGSRQFRSGVDPNRNWPGPGWEADAYDSNGVFRVGLGGSEPFSEPETLALRDYLLATRPAFTINYHSRGGFLFGGRGERSQTLSEAYARASGYYRPTPGTGGSAPRLLGYRVTGAMNLWMADQGLAGILVELATSTDSEFARNLAGLQAVLALLASEER
jgi:hypothetical protein